MKLQDLEVIVTSPPAPGWGGRYWILVKVTTDTGIVGWGECYASSIGPAAMKARNPRCVRPSHGGTKSRGCRTYVSTSLFKWLYSKARFDCHGGIFRFGNRLLGYSRERP